MTHQGCSSQNCYDDHWWAEQSLSDSVWV